jgi:hypothetical protein
MPKISRDYGAALGALSTLHPREDLIVSGNLASLNSEIIVAADGCNTVSVDLRGTFNATFEVAGSVDGVNWHLILVQQVAVTTKLFVNAITGTTQGIWVGKCGWFRFVRVRCTAYTSGAAAAILMTGTGQLDDMLDRAIVPLIVTTTGVAGAAVTLTLPAPGVGMRQYLTYFSLVRINGTAAALTAAAGPINITTTNLPGSLVFSIGNGAIPAGESIPLREDMAFPLAASALNTAITFVAPISTGAIWRMTAGYFNYN